MRKLFKTNYYRKKIESLEPLEKLLGMKLKVPKKVNNYDRIPDAISIDDKIGIELSFISHKDIINDQKYNQIMKEMNEYEYRYINGKIIRSGIINIPIKVIIDVEMNYQEKLWKKINRENLHFFVKNTNIFKYDHSIIILNCKLSMYDNIFSDCQYLLKKYGKEERYKNKLIGILIVYPKDIKDIELSFDDNILIRNPYCEYNPFTNLVVYKGQKFTTHYGISIATMFSIPENTEKISLRERIKLVGEIINKYQTGRILGYHGIGIKNCTLINITINNKEIEIVDNDGPS